MRSPPCFLMRSARPPAPLERDILPETASALAEPVAPEASPAGFSVRPPILAAAAPARKRPLWAQ